VTLFKIGVPTFLAIFLLLMFYFMSIKKSYYKLSGIVTDKKSEKGFNTVISVISGLISLFISSIFSGNLWFTILQYLNSTNFNIVDPIFGRDISFYMFKLPLLSELINLLMLLAFIMVVLTVIFYFVLLTIRRPNNESPNVFDFNDLANSKEQYKNIGTKIFNIPIFSFGSADDELFKKLKEPSVIGEHFLLPKEWLTNAKTVISFYIIYQGHGIFFPAVAGTV